MIKLILFFILLSGVLQLQAQHTQKSLAPPKNGGVYVIAHRGAHIGIPENTLPAYQKAIDLGCDFVEIDLRSTKDGHLISIHNSTIDAYVEGKSGRVNDFTLEEIKSLNIGKRVGPEWESTRVPTVEEVLQLCQNKIGIYLDLKEPLVEELVELIKKYEMENQVVWCIPFRHKEAIEQVKQLCPDCIPMPDPGDEVNVIPAIEAFDPVVIAPVMGDFSETYVPKAHKRGVLVFLDERDGGEKEWDWILKHKVDGIQTDDPEGLIKFIKDRNN